MSEIYRSELDISDETIKIQNFHFNQKVMLKKLQKIIKNCYVTEKRIGSKLSKILILKFDSTN